MDLSQQELPLTAYFSKGTKTTKPLNRGESAHPSTSGGKSSKRKRNADHSARNSKSSTAQLPTPASSSRIRKRPSFRGVRESSRDSLPLPPSVTHSRANTIPLDGTDSELLALDDFASNSSSTSRQRLAQPAGARLTTPVIDQRKRQRTDAYGSESPSRCRPSARATAIALPTPLTASRKIPELIHDVKEQSPTKRCLPKSLPPRPDFRTEGLPGSAILHKLCSPSQFLAQATSTLLHSRVDLGSSDPFQTSDVSALSKPPEPDDRSPKLFDVPMVPIPSSQSQYLLRIDATPKRKRVIQPIDIVSSSLSEERELNIPIPVEAFDSDMVPGEQSPPKHPLAIDVHTPRSHTHKPCPGRSERKSQHAYTLGSTPIASPITSPAGPSRSFFATKKPVDTLPSAKTLRAFRHKTKTPLKSPRKESVTDIPHIPDDDSLTEPESELDIIQMRDRTSPSHNPDIGKPPSAFKSHSQRSRKSTQGRNFNSAAEDSATEAESDTEILHCVAQISRKQGREGRSRVSNDDFPSRPVISPLVSPARSRIAASFADSTQFFMQEGAGLSIPLDRSPSRPCAISRLSTRTESVPSVVRNFIDMFEGDESYPADFPESLRF